MRTLKNAWDVEGGVESLRNIVSEAEVARARPFLPSIIIAPELQRMVLAKLEARNIKTSELGS